MKHESITPPTHSALAGHGLPARTSRRGVEVKAHVLRPDGKIVDVVLLDLSYGGCKVRTAEFLWQNEAVKLSVPQRGVINAHVRWCTDGIAGLEFDPEPKVPTRAKVERSSARINAEADVMLRRVGHVNFRVGVRDISPTGCRIDLVERPNIGETMHLKIDGLDVLECKVCWIDGYIAGLEFVRPMHRAVFDLLALRLQR